uniref:hypothetical protein n=1 Tax=Candidatus Electrothrix sp. TaxID=2170559 RepID=UPI004055A95B
MVNLYIGTIGSSELPCFSSAILPQKKDILSTTRPIAVAIAAWLDFFSNHPTTTIHCWLAGP